MRIGDLAAGLAVALSVLMLPEGASAASGPKPVCRGFPGYLVITREKNGDAGNDIIIRHAASAVSKKSSCVYQVKPGDYVLGEGDDAVYFLAMRRQFLALDAGTGPDRQLFVYDVALRRKLVAVPYDDARHVDTGDDGFVYWEVSAVPIKPQSCPAAWRQAPGNRDAKAAHATHEVNFTFADSSAHDTGKTSCTRTQDDM